MNEAAIACEGLWMVFGANARREFENLQRQDPGLAAQSRWERLQERGLIPAVCDVSFEVAKGELFVVMGLSGSGKSTVVRCISRLLEPTAGTIEVLGDDILRLGSRPLAKLRRERIGMVFQHFGLFPHMTVADNVAFPLKVQGLDLAARRKRAIEVIEKVGLAGREDAYPRQLSGGQRQRVGIARSLAVNPDIWLLDEPFSALDPLIRRQLQDEFLNLQSELHKSIVFITHDISEALKIADRIAIMRDGVIVQVGTPAEIVLNPADDYIAEFARDIPRGRLMTVECLIEPLNGAIPPAGSNLKPQMTLEAALSAWVLEGAGERMPVEDGQGRIIGAVSAGNLARAVAEAGR